SKAELQWGHATRGVEDQFAATRCNGPTIASMGPRHEGRGRLGWWERHCGGGDASMGARHEGGGRRKDRPQDRHRLVRFKGATPRGAWKTAIFVDFARSKVGLQWGHATRGVEDHSPGHSARLPGYCFNGATPRGAWKTYSVSGGALGTSLGFNGATPRGAWK